MSIEIPLTHKRLDGFDWKINFRIAKGRIGVSYGNLVWEMSKGEQKDTNY